MGIPAASLAQTRVVRFGNRDLRQLRHGQPGRRQLLHPVRHAAGDGLPGVRPRQPAGRPLLRELRVGAAGHVGSPWRCRRRPIAMAVAERRLVSVLFADLVGFTTRSEDRDPEETRELLSRYFEVARRIVEGHGGTIEKFIGDAVMAVWGAPTAHEDDAERAVRSALAIVAGVGSIADGDQPLHVRAAVLTGEAAVTVGAAGRAWSPATWSTRPAACSRWRSRDGAGGRGHLSGHQQRHRLRARRRAGAEGQDRPVEAWRAVAVVARRGGSGRASTLEPPFVGREDELQQLEGPVRRDRPGAEAAAGDGHRAGRHRQVRLAGSSRSTWTAWSRRRTGTRPHAGLRRGDQLLGAGRDGPAAGADRRGRGRRLRPAEADRHAGAVPGRSGGAPLGGAAPGRPAGPGGAAQRRAEELFAAWRTLFERIAAQAPRCSSSWTCTGPIRACSTSSRTCWPGPATRRSSWWRWPGQTAGATSRLGQRGAQRDAHQPGAAGRAGDGAAAGGPGARPPGRGRRTHRGARRGDPAVCGGDGPHAAGHRFGGAGGRTTTSCTATCRSWPCRRRCRP